MSAVLASSPAGSYGRTVPRRVLVVEDNEDLRSSIHLILAMEGYDVRESCNGAEALAELRPFAPDLILLDLSMPVMDGPTFLRRLRTHSDAALAATPVVVLTANPDLAPGGGEPLLTKPFELQELLAAVRRAQ